MSNRGDKKTPANRGFLVFRTLSVRSERHTPAAGITAGIIVDFQLPRAVCQLTRQVAAEGADHVVGAAAAAVVQVVDTAIRRDQINLQVTFAGVNDAYRDLRRALDALPLRPLMVIGLSTVALSRI